MEEGKAHIKYNSLTQKMRMDKPTHSFITQN